MNTSSYRKRVCARICVVGCTSVAASALLWQSSVFAAGDVTACDWSSLQTALIGGGDVVFKCSGTISIPGSIDITANTTLDASGQSVTLSGNGINAVIRVSFFFDPNGPATLTLKNVTVANGGQSGIINFGTLNLLNSTVTANIRGYNSRGGGIHNRGQLNVVDSTISSNTAQFGGAIYNFPGRTTTINRSTISDNTVRSTTGDAGIGGGILNDGGTVTATNTTISANSVSMVSGATTGGKGGAIANIRPIESTAVPSLHLTNSTIYGNSSYVLQFIGATAISGAGVYNSGGTVSTTNTLFARNTQQIGQILTEDANCAGGLPNDLGYNLDGGVSCGFSAANGSLVNTDPMVGPLTNNGGLTATHALLEGSSALDAIPSASCRVTEDQRGVSRPQGVNCDIGAFEYVYPITPAEWIEITLQNFVDTGALTQQQADVLMNQIETSQEMADRGSITAACKKVDAFINVVQAYLKSGRLTIDQSDLLIDYAYGYQSDLVCPLL